MQTATIRHQPEGGYLAAVLLALGAVVVGLVGYGAGFLGFAYQVMLPDAFSRLDVLTLAAVMGVAAFFSPCAFPLLPAYVTYQLEAQGARTRLGRALALGALAATGVVAVNVVLGLVIAALGTAAPFNADPRQDPPLVLAPRLLGGLLVTYLGALYLMGRGLSLGPLERLAGTVRVGEGEPRGAARESFLYGALYNVIGVGCTGALLLALVVYTLTVGSFWLALGAFVAFSATMAVLMVAVTALVGISRPYVLRRLRASIPAIRRVSGAVMLVVGALTVGFVLQGNEIFTRIFFPFFR